MSFVKGPDKDPTDFEPWRWVFPPWVGPCMAGLISGCGQKLHGSASGVGPKTSPWTKFTIYTLGVPNMCRSIQSMAKVQGWVLCSGDGEPWVALFPASSKFPKACHGARAGARESFSPSPGTGSDAGRQNVWWSPAELGSAWRQMLLLRPDANWFSCPEAVPSLVLGQCPGGFDTQSWAEKFSVWEELMASQLFLLHSNGDRSKPGGHKSLRCSSAGDAHNALDPCVSLHGAPR